MMENSVYDDFMTQYQNYPQELLSLIEGQRALLPINVEDENYNLGTMQKDTDIGLSSNLAVINAHSFEKSFADYKKNYPQMSETEAKARVVFDFLNAHGVNDLSYEQNKDDFLFKDNNGNNVSRENFYAAQVYKNALSNTNFFDRNVGNIQVLCLEPKSVTAMPRNIKGISQEKIDKFMNIPDEERLQILYKRGLYHEALHMAMGTTDERKCDVFALLKTMREHPKYAETVFDVYNAQRSKMGYTINAMRKREGEQKKRAIKNGAMTYLMPNTYTKLKKYALNPHLIPQQDAEILQLTCEMTSEPEFSKAQLSEYAKLMAQDHLSPQDLAGNEIVQTCMKQGGFDNIDSYIASDNNLSEIMSNEHIAGRLAKAKEQLVMRSSSDKKLSLSELRCPSPVVKAVRESTPKNVDFLALRLSQNKKQNE